MSTTKKANKSRLTGENRSCMPIKTVLHARTPEVP